MRTPQSIQESVSIVIHFSTFLGLFPVRFNGEKRLQTSKLLQMTTILISIGFSACLVVAIIEESSSDGLISGNYYESNKVSSFGLLLAFIGGTVFFYTTYICSLFKTRNIISCLEKISTVDVTLKKMGETFRYKRDAVYSTATFLFGFLMISAIMTLQGVNAPRENFKVMNRNMRIILMYPLITVNLMCCQFSFTVLAIRDRLKKVNLQLSRVKDMKENISERIDALSNLYDFLCEAAKDTNKNFMFQLAVSLINQYSLTLFCIFYCYWMVSWRSGVANQK